MQTSSVQGSIITMHMLVLLCIFTFSSCLAAIMSSFIMVEQSSIRKPTKRDEQRRQTFDNSLGRLFFDCRL